MLKIKADRLKTRSSTSKENTTTPPAPNIFQTVPTELWTQIAADLPLSDQAALALTCQYGHTLFSKQVLELRLPENRAERLKLLFRIPKKFPAHYLCAQCGRYHLKSTEYDKYQPQYLFLHRSRQMLAWSDVAAGLQKHGRYPGSITGLKSSNVVLHTAYPGWRGGAEFLYSNKSRILFVLQYQVPVSVALQQDPTLPAMPTCQHVKYPPVLASQFAQAVNSTPRIWEPDNGTIFSHSSPVYRCPYCPSEYRIVVKEHGTKEEQSRTGIKYHLFLERFVDVGEGLSPHSVEWDALTRPRPAGVSASVPFDIEGRGSIAQRYCDSALRDPRVPHDAVVLPLLDI